MRKGRILFDGEVFCWVRSGGLFSSSHILTALQRHFSVSLFVTSEFRDRVGWFQQQYNLAEGNVIVLPVTRRPLLALKLVGLPPLGLEISDHDVVFLTSTNVFRGLPQQICVCHDFMAVTDSKYFKLRDRLNTKLQISRLRDSRISLICHSELVAEQAIRLCGVEPDRILKVPLGLANRPVQKMDHGRPVLPNRPMEGLFVSAFHPRKNFEQLIRHVRRLNREFGHVLRLTVAGPGVSIKLQSKADEIIRVLDFVPADDYPALFRSSDVYINPSAAEGFGISNLDAQGYGLPVACNDIPVFHEILGDSASYFEAGNYESFSRCILRVLKDSAYRARLIAAGLDNVQGPTYPENIDSILMPWLIRKHGDTLELATTKDHVGTTLSHPEPRRLR